MSKDGKELVKMCKVELDLSAFISDQLKNQIMLDLDNTLISKVFVNAQAYPEAKNTKERKLVDNYIKELSVAPQLIVKTEQGLIEKTAGFLFVPVKAFGNVFASPFHVRHESFTFDSYETTKEIAEMQAELEQKMKKVAELKAKQQELIAEGA